MKLKAGTLLKMKLTFYFCLWAIFVYDILAYFFSKADAELQVISWFAPLLIIALSLDFFTQRKRNKQIS